MTVPAEKSENLASGTGGGGSPAGSSSAQSSTGSGGYAGSKTQVGAASNLKLLSTAALQELGSEIKASARHAVAKVEDASWRFRLDAEKKLGVEVEIEDP